MIAILSDIHGNLEALTACLDDVRVQGADTIFCLGDLVGYGPDPCECIVLAMNWNIVLRGNYDDALIDDSRLPNWPEHLQKMMIRLRTRVSKHANAHQIFDFLKQCQPTYSHDSALFVHGSPRDPLDEYIFPEHVYDRDFFDAVFSCFRELCFCGHSHIPGIYHYENDRPNFTSPEQCDYQFGIGRQKLLCNVGSVGQPRDGDPRACYALLKKDMIEFRRVDYDYESTIKKIRDDDDEDDMHANRLPMGR